MTTLVAFLFVLGVLIFVHELGHFLAARFHGVRVLTFSLGFGPNPSENVSTRTPTRRAARKCPSSWTKMRTPRTKRKARRVVNYRTSSC